MKSVISEVMGYSERAYQNPNPPQGNFNPTLFRQDTRNPEGYLQQSSRSRGVFRPRFCHQMSGWQNSVVRLLERQDVYVTASPSAGKTMPMFCYWFQNILGLQTQFLSDDDNTKDRMNNMLLNVYNILTNTNDFRKLIILVPVVSLAERTHEEFTEDLVDLIGNYIYQTLHFSIRNQNIRQMPATSARLLTIFRVINDTQPAGTNKDVANARYNLIELNQERERLQETYHQFVSRLETTRTQATHGANDPNVNAERERLSAEIEILANQIRTVDTQIDEAVAIKVRTFVSSRLVAILTGPTKSPKGRISECLVAVATYQSAKNLLQKYIPPDQVGMLVCDEAHLMQEYPNELKDPQDDSTQSEQIAENVYYALTNLPRETRIMLLSGTIHPESANELSEYFRLCLNRQLRIFGDIPEGNPARISILPSDWLMDQNKVIQNLLVSPVTDNNLLLIFSKRRIIDMIKLTAKRRGMKLDTLATVDQGVRIDKTLSRNRFSSKPPIRDYDSTRYYRNSNYTPMSQNTTEIFYPLQKLAVSMGIGFVFRMDNKIPGYDEQYSQLYQNDFLIVQKLFAQGVIKTILATDAVGIGVNMTVANMYIPSLEKPTFHGGLELIKTAELSQLLHRTGRRAFPAANIYSPTKYVGKVNEALSISRTGRDIEKRTTIKLNRGLCKSIEIFKGLISR